jgi:parallel beta-helix repeat protein
LTRSRYNLISGNAVQNGGIGIELNAKALNNTVNQNTVLRNTEDLVDKNANCANNLWTNNTFDAANPLSCIK